MTSTKSLSIPVKKFLSKNQISFSSLIPIKNDASNRHYFVLKQFKGKRLLVDSSLEKQSLDRFVKISLWLKKKKYSSPKIYEVDKKLGILIIENFGLNKFSYIFKNQKSNKIKYYKKAINLLIKLSNIAPPNFLARYDYDILFKELDLFYKWHLGYEKKIHNKQILEWNFIWENLFNKIRLIKPCMVLRDFHIDNIFYLAQRKKPANIGLIDFQDALIGHASYDLVSLIQDVRTFISLKDQILLYNHYVKNKKVDSENFRTSYLIYGTQRLFKIIGIFNKLAKKSNKMAYLKYLPRTWVLLKNNLKDPLFNDLNDWLIKNNNIGE